MVGSNSGSDAPRAEVRRPLSELDVAALATRILDAERRHVVVVVTSGYRPPAERLDADRIAIEVGPEAEVVTLPTGTLTYALEHHLPPETHVFGDAARTYPVGVAWQTRPDLSALRLCRADSDARRIEAKVIADARAAVRHATRAASVAVASGPVAAARAPASPRRVGGRVTPAMLPGAPKRPAPTGPTPANPRGTPTRQAQPPAAPPAPGTHPEVGGVVPRPSLGSRLASEGPWHARTSSQGRVLAEHLMAVRDHPVLVVTTPHEDSLPLVDAEGLFTRVRQIADVVVLHNGPASWALADAMPAMTQVYGGAGRVYPIDLGWLSNPYRAPIRFCWPGDDPSRVADRLEDDAFAAANLAELTASQTATATLAVTGRVKGFLDRHHALLALDRGGDAAVLVDQLHPGVEPERLLRPGQVLAGRIERGHMLPEFLPDAIDDDPFARATAAFRVGDVVLARVVELAARSGRALLHPDVVVTVVADDEADLRNLVAVDDVVTLTVLTLDGSTITAELADADAPSVTCLPVLPGGPPWLVEDDLPASTPQPEPEPESVSPPAPPPVSVSEPLGGSSLPSADAPGTTASVAEALTPATLPQHARAAALSAQIRSLTELLVRERRESQRHEQAAARARREAQDLRRQLKSVKAQHEAFRDRVEGASLFTDPEEQLRYDIEQNWLRRTPEPERPSYPLLDYRLGPSFLTTLADLEGISRDKVLDVLVEVLTDRAKEIPGRDLHPLRESASSQSQRIRADGAKAWRCALQVNTPSARRLHYWRCPDGTIELDSVGTHDGGT